MDLFDEGSGEVNDPLAIQREIFEVDDVDEAVADEEIPSGQTLQAEVAPALEPAILGADQTASAASATTATANPAITTAAATETTTAATETKEAAPLAATTTTAAAAPATTTTENTALVANPVSLEDHLTSSILFQMSQNHISCSSSTQRVESQLARTSSIFLTARHPLQTIRSDSNDRLVFIPRLQRDENNNHERSSAPK